MNRGYGGNKTRGNEGRGGREAKGRLGRKGSVKWGLWRDEMRGSEGEGR